MMGAAAVRSGSDYGQPEPCALRIVVAGGGTGGHLFPGIAMAEALAKRHPQTCLWFVSTGNAMERTVLAKAALPLETVRVEPLKGRGRWRQVRALARLPLAVAAAWRVLHRLDPQLLIGVGSYSSGPVILAGKLMRRKIVLHEQNVRPGLTNRMLAGLADRIYVSFDKSQACFPAAKVRLTGNPVRRQIRDLAAARQPLRSDAPFTVLVIGGSQGAQAINTAVVDALSELHDPKAFFFIHQTGPLDEAAVRQGYRTAKVAARVQPFFDDMEQQYGQADLVICRAGATTVAELTAIGQAALFIPYPFAADDHQTQNAQALAGQGAAEVLPQSDLSGPRLAQRINYFAQHRPQLYQMGAAARRWGRPDAAEAIAADCLQLIAADNAWQTAQKDY